MFVCTRVFMLFSNQPRVRKALESRTNMEDDRVAILETQLTQVKHLAEEADKKFGEVNCVKIYQQKFFQD